MLQISLRAARVNAGLTQEAAAKAVGVDKSTIISWEKGKTSPRIEDIKELCSVYKIEMNYIFCQVVLLKRTAKAKNL